MELVQSVSKVQKQENHHIQKHTVQKLLTSTLNTLSRTTRRIALHLALKPTITIMQAPRPNKLTMIRHKLHWPEKTNPIKRKINSTRPANWTYILRSFSSNWGKPAGTNFLRTHESDRTISRPPTTLKLRRKKLRSKMRPYPRPWVTTTPSRPATPISVCLRATTRKEHIDMAMTFRMRNECVTPQGTIHQKPQVSPLNGGNGGNGGGNQWEERDHTLAVVTQVQKLVTPLSENAKTILDESNNNQETTNGW